MTGPLEHDPPSGSGQQRWVIPAQAPDTRPDSEVCGICCRSLLPRRAVYRHRLPVCRACASLTRGAPAALVDWWLRLPRRQRRAMITVAFELDPVTCAPAAVESEWSEVTEDADGIPSAVAVKTGNYAFGAGKFVLPLPCYWQLWTQRPRATHH